MNKLLIVVDYQVDFVSGALGFPGAELLESKIADRIKLAKQNGEDVIFTKDVHDKLYLNSEEGKHLPIEHCIENTAGCELVGKIEGLSKGEKIFAKGAFGSIELGNYLLDKDYKEITIVGLVSYICVLANAIICKSALPNAHIIVEKDLVDAADKHAQEIGFEALRNVHIEIR